MLPDKSVLLEQIDSAIKRNSCKPDTEHSNCSSFGNPVQLSEDPTDKSYFSNSRYSELFKKLEHRIEALEDQNDRLLYFIHFLYINFPDLVKDILPLDNYEGNGRNYSQLSGESQLVIKNDSPAITRRELEILNLLVKGLCAKEIATILFISETTVITHKKNLKEKFNAKNTVELISKAFSVLLKTG